MPGVAVYTVRRRRGNTLPAREEKVKVVLKGALGRNIGMAFQTRIIAEGIRDNRRVVIVTAVICEQVARPLHEPLTSPEGPTAAVTINAKHILARVKGGKRGWSLRKGLVVILRLGLGMARSAKAIALFEPESVDRSACGKEQAKDGNGNPAPNEDPRPALQEAKAFE